MRMNRKRRISTIMVNIEFVNHMVDEQGTSLNHGIPVVHTQSFLLEDAWDSRGMTRGKIGALLSTLVAANAVAIETEDAQVEYLNEVHKEVIADSA